MAYDPQEQEQIDAVRAFWQRWGNAILGLLTVALLAYAGSKAWDWYQWRQAATASAHYDQVIAAIERKDAEAIRTRARVLMDDYPATAYAQMAGLGSARALLDSGDRGAATESLKWVVAHGVDSSYRVLARLRLAAIQLDDKAYDEALATLSAAEIETASADLRAAASDQRADTLFAAGKAEQARAEYDKALAVAGIAPALREVIQLKRDATRG